MVEAKYILPFVSLIIMGYIFLINHFLRDLDDFCNWLDEVELELDKAQEALNELNYREVYYKLRRVHRSIFPVSFGVSGILTLIIFFLVWITGILGICSDVREFWWIPIPILVITWYFWKQFLDHIEGIYNIKYRNCRTLFRNYFTEGDREFPQHLPENLPEGNENFDPFWNPRQDDFLQLGEFKNSILRGWKKFWWTTLIWGVGTLVLLVLGIGDKIFYQIGIGSFVLAFLIPLLWYVKSCWSNTNHELDWWLIGKYISIWIFALTVGLFAIMYYDIIQEIMIAFIDGLMM